MATQTTLKQAKIRLIQMGVDSLTFSLSENKEEIYLTTYEDDSHIPPDASHFHTSILVSDWYALKEFIDNELKG